MKNQSSNQSQQTIVAIICNYFRHADELLIKPLNLDRSRVVIISPESTEKMRGYRDIYFYEMRPMYAREQELAQSADWKSCNKTELQELAGL